MESPSDLTYGRVQELRDALASKGMVLKDSILARFAKLKPPLVNPGACAVAPPSQANPSQDEAPERHQRPSPVAEEQEAKGPASNGASICKPPPLQPKKHGRPQDTSSSTDEGRVLVVKPATETEEERKRRRSERFGTVDEDEKLRSRAARFGPISGVADGLKEDPGKLQARAARFGIVDEEAKKKARLERFGKAVQEESTAEREKMLARIARFSSAEGKALSIAKKE